MIIASIAAYCACSEIAVESLSDVSTLYTHESYRPLTVCSLSDVRAAYEAYGVIFKIWRAAITDQLRDVPERKGKLGRLSKVSIPWTLSVQQDLVRQLHAQGQVMDRLMHSLNS